MRFPVPEPGALLLLAAAAAGIRPAAGLRTRGLYAAAILVDSMASRGRGGPGYRRRSGF
jgi:hypothetical protein